MLDTWPTKKKTTSESTESFETLRCSGSTYLLLIHPEIQLSFLKEHTGCENVVRAHSSLCGKHESRITLCKGDRDVKQQNHRTIVDKMSVERSGISRINTMNASSSIGGRTEMLASIDNNKSFNVNLTLTCLLNHCE